MSTLKKIFFISLLILFLSLLFWAIYNFAFRDKTATDTSKKDTPALDKNSSTNDTSVKKISLVSKTAILAPTLSPTNDSIYYFYKNNSQPSQSDFYGENSKLLSAETFPSLTDASWSVDKSKVILKTKNQNNLFSFSAYDLSSKINTPLKSNLDQVVWQTNANRIFYKYYDQKTNTRTLNVSDPDGSNWTKLADLDYRDVSIAQIPKTGLVSFWNSGDAYLQSNFQSMPLLGGKPTGINSHDFGSDYLWNDAGDWVLTSHTNQKGGSKMELGIMNMSGGEYKNLNIPTFITKCVWSKDGKTIFYALPGEIPENSVLPNDYKENKFQTADTFWKVNVKTGEKTRLVEIKEMADSFDASQLFLNQSESLLFFVNKIDGKLYKIIL